MCRHRNKNSQLCPGSARSPLRRWYVPLWHTQDFFLVARTDARGTSAKYGLEEAVKVRGRGRHTLEALPATCGALQSGRVQGVCVWAAESRLQGPCMTSRRDGQRQWQWQWQARAKGEGRAPHGANGSQVACTSLGRGTCTPAPAPCPPPRPPARRPMQRTPTMPSSARQPVRRGRGRRHLC